MSGVTRIGDIVLLKAADGAPAVRGQIVGGEPGAWTFQPLGDGSAAQRTLADEAFDQEGFLGPNRLFMTQAGEIGGNALVYAIIQKIRSNPTFGHRFMSFVISDISYQLLLRGFMDRLIPQMRPDSTSYSNGVQMGDVQDALKAIPVTIIQQIVCKILYKQGFTTHIFKNLFDSALAYAGSNVMTRNVSAYFSDDNARKFVYRY